MKILRSVVLIIFLPLISCTAGINGTQVSAGQTYWSPYAPSMDNTAVVYIFWRQPDIERYIPFGTRKPEWFSYVNRKRNALLVEGGYSVVEAEPGRVTIETKSRLGMSSNLKLSDRPGHMSLSVKAGEVYFVYARLDQTNLGLELHLERELVERDAYQRMYGLIYQENMQDSVVY